MTMRQQYRVAFSFMRRVVKRPDTMDPITLPSIAVRAWEAATAAALMRSRVDETHGVMRWTPAGRVDVQMVAGHRYRLRYGPHRPVKPLPGLASCQGGEG